MVLVLVPQAWLRDLLTSALQQAGCLALQAPDLAGAEQIVASVVPDIVAFDEALVGEVGAWLPGLKPGTEGRCVPGLMLGHAAPCPPGVTALAKPIEPRQFVTEAMLLLRQMRQQRPRAAASIRVGPLTVAAEMPMLRLGSGDDERVLTLPRREHALLRALLDPPIRVRSREELLATAWSGEPVSLRTVDQYVRRLRASLAPHGLRELVRTVSSAGYRIDPSALEIGRASRTTAVAAPAHVRPAPAEPEPDVGSGPRTL
jgi:two-component system phosphate regulon response regulator PhoB